MPSTLPNLNDILSAGAKTLGLALSPEQLSQLLAYQALIGKWSRVYNLTAVRDPQEMLTHHLLDSLAVLTPLQRHVAGGPLKLLDVGSGAGLPGVVVAIALPQAEVVCVDTVAKKATFIRQVAAELGLPRLQAVHARVEDMPASGASVVTSRAFASLADFTALTRHHLAPNGVWLAMKGKHPAEELAALPPDIELFHVEQLQVPGLDAERCLLWMRPRVSLPPQSAAKA